MKGLRRPTWAIAAAVLLAGHAAAAESPRDELLRFVPEDMGFCFVMQDLRVHAADLAASPFAEQLRQSQAWAALWASPELKQLEQLDKVIQQQLGVSWERLRDDIFGDAIVLAYRPGPPGKADQEQGLVLVRARNAEVLAELVENLNKAQKKDGTLTELEERRFKDESYFRRVERNQTNYYLVRGPVLLFSGQEAMLRQAIEASRAPAGEPALARRLREVGADRAALALWLNPRAFDARLEDKAGRAEGADAALQKKVLTYWKALDGLAAWVTLDAEFHLSVAGQVRLAELPAALRRLLSAGAAPSDLWAAFPDDALVACGGRIDAAALLDLLQDLGPKDDAAANAPARDFVKDVLARVGPDWGFCLRAPAADDKDGLPQALLAVRVAGGDDAAPVDQALLSAVHTAALLGVLAYNRQHPTAPLRVKAEQLNDKEVHFIVGDGVLPPGLRPAYGLVNGWMAFGSSPGAVLRFTGAATKAAPADGAAFPVLRLSLKAWRGYLTDRGESLAAALAPKNGLTVEETRKRLNDLTGVLQFVDRLEVDCQPGTNRAEATLTIQTARPLRK